MAKVEVQMEQLGIVSEPTNVDPVSGNKIPLGATAEGVRDDQTAAISPGEFVIPDYAVRYHGLDFYVDSLQQAQQGLQQMEGMGLVGNPDEQTIPDEAPLPTMPMQSPEEEPQMGFQTGGLTTVPLQQPQQQTVAPPMLPQSQIIQPARPVSTQPVPTAQPAPQSSYLDLQGYTVDPYINEAGNIIYLTSMGGRVQGGIPPGYRKAEPKDLAYSPQPVTMEPTPTVTDSQLQQPQAGFDPDRGALPDDVNFDDANFTDAKDVMGYAPKGWTYSEIAKLGLAAVLPGGTLFAGKILDDRKDRINAETKEQQEIANKATEIIERQRSIKAFEEEEQQQVPPRSSDPPVPTTTTPPAYTGDPAFISQADPGSGPVSPATGSAAISGGMAQGFQDVEGFGTPAGAGAAGAAAAEVASRDPGLGTLWKKGGLVSKKMKQKKGSKGLASV